jgi:tetratricopeptide (TPR) repeat protein
MAMRLKTTAFLILFALAISVRAPAASKTAFELSGRVLQSDGEPFRRLTPVIFLQSALAPFNVHTLADSAGGFKFKNLPAGMYSLIVSVPRAGEMIRTIEVGPSFADAKGRVTTTISFERNPETLPTTVSAATLGISVSARTEYRKAQDRLSRHDISGAVAHLKKAVEISPQFAAALNNLGTISYQMKAYAEAEGYFRQALEQEPDSYAPLVNLGGALLSGGKIEAALPFNLRAVRARPEDALAHAQLGQNYFYLGQLDPSEVELKKAKALDPGHFSFPQLILAQLYMMKQKPVLAVEELEEFLKLHPDSERADRIRKTIQDLRGKFPEDSRLGDSRFEIGRFEIRDSRLGDSRFEIGKLGIRT